MDSSPFIWLICNLVSVACLAAYSMIEMACVSFNKIRLQYYVSKGVKRAIWLNELLQNPSKLFGTTLIGVNIALVIGSECARQFYSSIGLSPDLAPITQVILVVIFGELAPMFAARHYAEHVAMLGIPLIYASYKLMSPILWGIGIIYRWGSRILGGYQSDAEIYLNQEELLKILEEQSDEPPENTEFTDVATNIFNLRGREIKQIMEPLSHQTALPSNATVANAKAFTKNPHRLPPYLLWRNFQHHWHSKPKGFAACA
jgi:putative hemolysin